MVYRSVKKVNQFSNAYANLTAHCYKMTKCTGMLYTGTVYVKAKYQFATEMNFPFKYTQCSD